MYVGITRARATLAVSMLRRRKRGRGRTAGAAEPLHRRDEARRGAAPRGSAREADGVARGRGGASARAARGADYIPLNSPA